MSLEHVGRTNELVTCDQFKLHKAHKLLCVWAKRRRRACGAACRFCMMASAACCFDGTGKYAYIQADSFKVQGQCIDMSELLGGNVSVLFSLFFSVMFSLILVVVAAMLLATLLSEDERCFWSEWYPFIDKKRRRIVLESNATGWVVLKEVAVDTGNTLRRVWYVPKSPFAFLGWKKKIVIPVHEGLLFSGEQELWDKHFGETKNGISILV